MSKEYAKRMKTLVALLEKQGRTEASSPGRSSHRKFKAPQGGLVTMPTSPSDHRSWRNLLSVLRRYGATIPR